MNERSIESVPTEFRIQTASEIRPNICSAFLPSSDHPFFDNLVGYSLSVWSFIYVSLVRQKSPIPIRVYYSMGNFTLIAPPGRSFLLQQVPLLGRGRQKNKSVVVCQVRRFFQGQPTHFPFLSPWIKIEWRNGKKAFGMTFTMKVKFASVIWSFTLKRAPY